MSADRVAHSSPSSRKRPAEDAPEMPLSEPFLLDRLRTVEYGERGTLAYRLRFEYEGAALSPWHDVPLQADGDCVHFLCEVPKWTRAKLEVAVDEPSNPLKQDATKAGLPREYLHGDMLFNYGALPQTWEDPEHRHPDTGCPGDNDPLDAVEVGCRQLPAGCVVPVKVLGVLAMVDHGETDWKVLVLRTDDPLAALIGDIGDLERELPGAVYALREWLRVYKVAEGKGANTFALGERAMDAAYARRVIAETHASWRGKYGSLQRKQAKL